MNSELRYKLKASIQNSIESAGKVLPGSEISQSTVVGLLYGVSIGMRDISTNTLAMGEELVDTSVIDSQAVKLLVSDMGEVLFLSHADVLEVANAVYEYRYRTATSPLHIYDSPSIAEYVIGKSSKEVSNYIFTQLMRVIPTINAYIKSYNEGE